MDGNRCRRPFAVRRRCHHSLQWAGAAIPVVVSAWGHVRPVRAPVRCRLSSMEGIGSRRQACRRVRPKDSAATERRSTETAQKQSQEKPKPGRRPTAQANAVGIGRRTMLETVEVNATVHVQPTSRGLMSLTSGAWVGERHVSNPIQPDAPSRTRRRSRTGRAFRGETTSYRAATRRSPSYPAHTHAPTV